MRLSAQIILPLVLITALGCRSPWSNPVVQSTVPVQVSVSLDPQDPETERLYEQCIREELSAFVETVPSAPREANATQLQVDVRPMDRTEAVRTVAWKATEATWDVSMTGTEHSDIKDRDRVIVTALAMVVVAPVSAAAGELRSIGENVRL